MTRSLFSVVGGDCPHSEAPYHLSEFTLENLRLRVVSIEFPIVKKQTYGNKSFAYTVGSSGYFDSLKRVLEKGRKSKQLLNILWNAPKLCAVTIAYTPFFLLSSVYDWFRTVNPKLMVLAPRDG